MIDGRPTTTLIPLLPEPSTASLRVNPSQAIHDGRTGLALSWNKSEIPAVPEVGVSGQPGYMPEVPADPAEFYRIEYSNTGPSDPGGYDWRLLGPNGSFTAAPTAAEPKQTGIDNADSTHQLATDPAQVALAEILTAGQERHYRVFAVNVEVDNRIMSTPTDGRSGTTANPKKPEPPTALRATAESHTSIKLRWRAPDIGDDPLDDRDGSEEGSSVIVGYYIQYLDDGASNWAHIKNEKDGSNLITDKDGKASTEGIHKGLVPGSSREYRVAAVNKISNSEQRSNWTELVKGSTTPIPLPNAVAGLVVEATGPSTVDMTWLAQAEQPQNAEVTEYVIEHSPDGEEGTFTVLTSVTAMTDDDVHSIHVDTGLSPETERHYRVYAKNARGISDQVSNVASATTSERMNTAPTAGAAIADQTVMVDATVMVQSTITDADTDDTLTWSAMSNMPTYATAEVDNMGMVTITGVAEGMATITVTATDMDGSGMSAMQEIMVTVSATPSETTAPMGADHSVLRNSISVTWDPNSAQNTTLIKVALFNEGVTALADIDAPVMAFNLEAATGDPGVHTFNNVPTGTYKVVVAAVDSEGMHIVSVVADPVEIN